MSSHKEFSWKQPHFQEFTIQKLSTMEFSRQKILTWLMKSISIASRIFQETEKTISIQTFWIHFKKAYLASLSEENPQKGMFAIYILF